MKTQSVSRRRVFFYRLLSLLITINILYPAEGAPLAVRAATGSRPGQSDPGAAYAEWPDEELFFYMPKVRRAVTGSCPAGSNPIATWELNGNLGQGTLGEPVVRNCDTGYHEGTDAAAGRILTPERDAVIYAYGVTPATGGDLAVRFGVPDIASPVTTLSGMAPRAGRSADFFAIAAGDLDGNLVADSEYRDEVVVAYAQADSTNKLPVKVAVLAFDTATEAAPQLTAKTEAVSSGKLDAASILSSAIVPMDTALGVAVGDFDGDRLAEIAIAYLSGPQALTVEVFRYRVTTVGGTITRSLQRVGGMSYSTSFKLTESLPVAAGDFDGDGRSELALAKIENVSSNPKTSAVSAELFRFTTTDNFNLTVTRVTNTEIWRGPTPNDVARVQLVAGLFKYDEANGWGLSRRQLAAAVDDWNDAYVDIQTMDVQSDLQLTVYQPEPFPMSGSFRLAAGAFTGSRSSSNPVWQLALGTTYPDLFRGGSLVKLTLLQPLPGGSLEPGGDYIWPENFPLASVARMPLLAYDWDGDTMYLGAPVHITVENLVSTDYIIQEPPKHAYWDPDLYDQTTGKYGGIVTISRYFSFNNSLTNSKGETLKSTATDTASWSVGGSAAYSASNTYEGHVDIGIASASMEVSHEISTKIAADYKEQESTTNSQYGSREVSFTGRTDADDFIVARLQTYDIWRYRILGLDPVDGIYPYFDIVMPGTYTLGSSAGGLTYDWYQPVHENGNLLSYPSYTSNWLPEDLGSYKIPCPSEGDTGCTPCEAGKDPACSAWGETKIIENTMIMNPVERAWDATSGSTDLTFTDNVGTETQRSNTKTLSESLDFKVKASAKASVSGKLAGGSTTFSESAEFEANNSNSWSNNATCESTTSRSTAISFTKPADGNTENTYKFYPSVYVTKDGTLKVFHSVSLTGDLWRSFYGKYPDLALNLPARFEATYSSNGVQNGWKPKTTVAREKMRGFFLSRIDRATGKEQPLSGAAVESDLVRLMARVYNYSVAKSTPVGIPVCFEAAPYDSSTNSETRPRTRLGCAMVPALAPLQMTPVTYDWDTTGFGGAGSGKQYRIYVVLDPPDTAHPCGQLEERYETENLDAACYPELRRPIYCNPNFPSQCVDPGQNNEGYGYATVAQQLPNDPRWGKPDAHVSMKSDGIAAINPRGKLVMNNVQAYLNEPLQIRVTVNSDTPGTDFSYVLIYDGDPDQGGALIAEKQVFTGSIAPEGSSVWLEWIPTTMGPHRLFAVLQQSVFDPAPGENTGMLKVEVIPVPPGQS